MGIIIMYNRSDNTESHKLFRSLRAVDHLLFLILVSVFWWFIIFFYSKRILYIPPTVCDVDNRLNPE